MHWICDILFIHSSADTDFGLFLFWLLGILLWWHHVQNFLWACLFISLDHTPRHGIAESYGKQVGKELPDYFSKQLHHLQFYHQYMKVPALPLFDSIFIINASDYRYPVVCDEVSHCGFWFAFSQWVVNCATCRNEGPEHSWILKFLVRLSVSYVQSRKS